MTGSFLERAQHTTLALTVTSGRSGTKLLAVLLRDALGLAAEHEPAPRVNFVIQQNARALGLSCMHVAMRGLLTHETLGELAAFLGAELTQEVFARQSAIVARNQNTRKASSGSDAEQPLPDDILSEERAVEAAVTAG
jgi:hypothetical protein